MIEKRRLLFMMSFDYETFFHGFQCLEDFIVFWNVLHIMPVMDEAHKLEAVDFLSVQFQRGIIWVWQANEWQAAVLPIF